MNNEIRTCVRCGMWLRPEDIDECHLCGQKVPNEALSAYKSKLIEEVKELKSKGIAYANTSESGRNAVLDDVISLIERSGK